MLKMLKNIFPDSKRIILVASGIIIILIFCLFVATVSGWVIFRTKEIPKPTIEAISIGYCGSELSNLCVTSFSQDVFGNTVINLFVPARRFSTFYLKAIRQLEESRYDCEWEKHNPTRVHCIGPTIGLGEGLELQVISAKDDSLIATGPFTLTAYLITTQTLDEEPIASTVTTPVPTKIATATLEPSPTPEETEPTPTPTLTPTLTPTPTP